MAQDGKYIVAVSGGVDSVVLLDMLATDKLPHGDLIICHFDHGIRGDSAQDAEFVKSLAEKYGLPFETKREELGANASEELARNRRYEFLRGTAKKYSAKILTAHHADDMVETIAINLTRGTGWRGVAVLDSPEVERPLMHMTKSEIKSYAVQHKLEWREDSTNRDTKYLRNDIRGKLEALDADAHRLLGLYRDRQVTLKRQIDAEAGRLMGESPYSRYMFTHAPDDAALELVRAMFEHECGISPTRPAMVRSLHAIKVLQAGRKFEVMRGVTLRFTRANFTVDVVL